MWSGCRAAASLPRRVVTVVCRPRTTPSDAANSHQPGDLVTAASDAGSGSGVPQLVLSVQAAVLHPQPVQLVGGIGLVELGGTRPEVAGPMRVVGGRRDRDPVLAQHLDDRIDSERLGVGGDVVDHDADRDIPLSLRQKNPALLSRIVLLRRSISGLVSG